MANGATVSDGKFIPGSDADSEDIFRFPFTIEEETIEYLKDHGRIMFIVRGLPGTGKDSFSELIARPHHAHVICSADFYFRDTFTPPARTPKSLADSHLFCHKKVKNACMKNDHPIIVKNTHVRKREFSQYLEYAEKYNYTVIMAVAMNKFIITPEILARSTTKGLSVEYFAKRLGQWEECPALVTGWFLGPEDSKGILKHLQLAMDSLLGDGRFCSVMNAYSTDELFKKYEARKILYCIAACGERNMPFEIKANYFSKDVQEAYGRCFTINITGFLLSESDALAVVPVDSTMLKLRHRKFNIEKYDDVQAITDGIGNLSAPYSDSFRQTASLHQDFKDCGVTVTQGEKNKDIDVNNCSLIYLAEGSQGSTSVPSHLLKKYLGLLLDAADDERVIRSDILQELDDGFRFCRLPENTWFLKLPQEISVKTVFTGLYV